MTRILAHRKYDLDRPTFVLWRWRDIGEHYLTRLYLVSLYGAGVLLHWIHRRDLEEACHDHPWSFVSLVLRGWYVEEVRRPDGTRFRRKVRWFNAKRYQGAHRIVEVSDPCPITLVLRAPIPRVRRAPKTSWGFWDGSTWVYWRDYRRNETRSMT